LNAIRNSKKKKFIYTAVHIIFRIKIKYFVCTWVFCTYYTWGLKKKRLIDLLLIYIYCVQKNHLYSVTLIFAADQGKFNCHVDFEHDFFDRHKYDTSHLGIWTKKKKVWIRKRIPRDKTSHVVGQYHGRILKHPALSRPNSKMIKYHYPNYPRLFHEWRDGTIAMTWRNYTGCSAEILS
jgi:hypothetical protein